MLNKKINSIPARFGDDHLCTQLMKLIPQFFGLQTTRDCRRIYVIGDVILDARYLVNRTIVVRVWRQTTISICYKQQGESRRWVFVVSLDKVEERTVDTDEVSLLVLCEQKM